MAVTKDGRSAIAATTGNERADAEIRVTPHPNG
jgi:hypothetical protein